MQSAIRGRIEESEVSSALEREVLRAGDGNEHLLSYEDPLSLQSVLHFSSTLLGLVITSLLIVITIPPQIIIISIGLI